MRGGVRQQLGGWAAVLPARWGAAPLTRCDAVVAPLARWGATPLARWGAVVARPVRWSAVRPVRWIAAPLVHWSAASLVYWSAAPLVHWSVAPLVHWGVVVARLVHLDAVAPAALGPSPGSAWSPSLGCPAPPRTHRSACRSAGSRRSADEAASAARERASCRREWRSLFAQRSTHRPQTRTQQPPSPQRHQYQLQYQCRQRHRWQQQQQQHHQGQAR